MNANNTRFLPDFCCSSLITRVRLCPRRSKQTKLISFKHDSEFKTRYKHETAGVLGRVDAGTAPYFVRTAAAYCGENERQMTQVHSAMRRVGRAVRATLDARHWIQCERDTRCYFNVRSKADISHLNLPLRSSNYSEKQKN